MSVFDRGTSFDLGSFDWSLDTIDPQGDTRHICEKDIPLCPPPSYPLTHHGSFTFHSRVLTHYSFPCALLSNRVSAPLYVVHIGHIGCHSLVVTWCDNLPRLFLKRWRGFGVFQAHPCIVLRPCWREQNLDPVRIAAGQITGWMRPELYALTESSH